MSSKLPCRIKIGDTVIGTSDGHPNFWGRRGIVSRITYSEGPDPAPLITVRDPKDSQFFLVKESGIAIVNRADQEEVEDAVCTQIKKRRDAGRAKYGTTMERTDLTILQWVQHAQEEAMDFSIYLEKLKRVLKEKGIE